MLNRTPLLIHTLECSIYVYLSYIIKIIILRENVCECERHKHTKMFYHIRLLRNIVLS